MNFKNKERVMKKIKKPSRNKKMNTWGRLGLVSGGTFLTLTGIRKQIDEITRRRRLAKEKNQALPYLLAGGGLLLAGILGMNLLGRKRKSAKKFLKVRTSVTINKDHQSVYDFWRQLENLPRFMEHISEVKEVSNNISHWNANLQNVNIAWDAQILEDRPGELISWKSLPGSEISTEGKVIFKDAGKGRTKLSLTLRYADDTGRIAKGFAMLYHPVFKNQVKNELARCKHILEVGENVPSREKQPELQKH